MDTDKKAFITFLIIAGLFFGYWIFSGAFSYVSDYFSKNNSTYSFEAGSNAKNSFIEDPNQEIENITNKIALNISDKFISDGNITKEDLTSSSTGNLLDKIDFKNINDVSEISNNISPEDFGIIYKADTSKLNIVPDSPSSSENYWSRYAFLVSDIVPKIQDTYFINSMLDSVTNSSESPKLKEFIKEIDIMYNSFAVMMVPQSFIGFHSNNLLFFKNLSSVLYSVLKYKEDPLRVYVLIEYLPNLINDWNEIEGFINEYAL